MSETDAAVWRRLNSAYRAGETVDGTVIRANAGGLIVDVGAHGFLRVALIERAPFKVEQLDHFVGEQISVKIIEMHAPSKNLVVSRRAALDSD